MNNAKTAPPINCGSCRACCHELIILDAEDMARKSDWKLADKADAAAITGGLSKMGLSPNGPVLERRPDGACIYLDQMTGCTIYQDRPNLCRAFHCGLWFRGLPADQRRDIQLFGDEHAKQMLVSGKKHAPKDSP